LVNFAAILRLISMIGTPDFKKMLLIAAESDIPVLIIGESGSGKELAAKELHFRKRKNKAFIAVNCGAISAGLAESLFCGHLKGAFTGANREQLGFIRAANGGTLFLDEVAELPMEVQKTLLRVLQEKSVTPLGEHREIEVNFRLVCATHRDLPALVAKGLFREDLYFRIAAMQIRIPPLRERLQDLRGIAEAIWRGQRPLNEKNFDVLRKYSWPGNVRQLKNVLERYALLKEHGFELDSIMNAEIQHCKFSLREPNPPKYMPSYGEINKEILNCEGNKRLAAKKLGISRATLYYKIAEAKSI